jgi:hypothetical protein
VAGRRIVIEFLGKDVSAGSAAAAVEKKFGTLGASLDKIGQRAGLALGAGLAAASAAAVKFGQEASDLAETQSKATQVFGQESVSALDKFAASAAKNMGQSKQQALDAASTFAVFGKSAGLAGNDLVKFSTDFTGLASDLASFHNTSPQEAIDAIGAALRGEAEPMRRYGVLLDDASMRQEALKLGLIKTTKDALTPQQKVLAAQALIYKQTSDAQGDFARTGDGLANKQRKATANMANLRTEIGARVVPILLKLTDAGLKATDWVSKHQRLTGILVVSVAGLAATLYAVSLAMRAATAAAAIWKAAVIIARNVQLAWNLAMMANPIGLVVIAIAAFVAALVFAYKHSETFRAIVDKAFRAVKSAAEFAFNWIRDNWKLLLAIITGPIGLAVSAIAKNWDAIKSGAATAVTWITTKWNGLLSFFKALPGKMGNLFGGMWDGIKNAFRSALNWVIDRWNALSFTVPSVKVGKKTFGGQRIGTPNIPRLAFGGIVSARPGGILANIGEGGHDEAVTPLSGPNAPWWIKQGPNGDDRPIQVQVFLDGKQIQTSLQRLKRESGMALGLS